jgi:hypothetical protein
LNFAAIDTHLVNSTDGGHSWTYAGSIFSGSQTTNPIDNHPAWINHEVMNLLPQEYEGLTYWWGINSEYLDEAAGGHQPGTRRWRFAVAPAGTVGPMALATATPTYYGLWGTDGHFPVTQDLSDPENSGALTGQLANCLDWYEPSLTIADNASGESTLYLFLQCNSANIANYFYAQFSIPAVPASGLPNSFVPGVSKWSYVPQTRLFANQSDANNLASRFFASAVGTHAPYITQMDIVRSSTPGQMLAVFDVAYNDSSGKVSLGCVAATLDTVSPPSFAYDNAGNVQVEAWWTSSDSTPAGPGSCTYDPDSATGPIIAHKYTNGSNPYDPLGFWSDLLQTKLSQN